MDTATPTVDSLFAQSYSELGGVIEKIQDALETVDPNTPVPFYSITDGASGLVKMPGKWRCVYSGTQKIVINTRPVEESAVEIYRAISMISSKEAFSMVCGERFIDYFDSYEHNFCVPVIYKTNDPVYVLIPESIEKGLYTRASKLLNVKGISDVKINVHVRWEHLPKAWIEGKYSGVNFVSTLGMSMHWVDLRISEDAKNNNRAVIERVKARTKITNPVMQPLSKSIAGPAKSPVADADKGKPPSETTTPSSQTAPPDSAPAAQAKQKSLKKKVAPHKKDTAGGANKPTSSKKTNTTKKKQDKGSTATPTNKPVAVKATNQTHDTTPMSKESPRSKPKQLPKSKKSTTNPSPIPLVESPGQKPKPTPKSKTPTTKPASEPPKPASMPSIEQPSPEPIPSEGHSSVSGPKEDANPTSTEFNGMSEQAGCPSDKSFRKDVINTVVGRKRKRGPGEISSNKSSRRYEENSLSMDIKSVRFFRDLMTDYLRARELLNSHGISFPATSSEV